MVDEDQDERPTGSPRAEPGAPAGGGATSAVDQHAEVRSALDGIEAAIDEVAATIARMS